ncbi:hypothetical protein K4F52_001126 [Lecanicillium sp. MT-2017a]|nr:hypothetical protein K4F52_001126 [Lecanicillium sp. MT-2017a]
MDPSSVSPRSDGPSPTPAGEQPQVIATTHLARFEFSDQGTKVLMVEWQPGTETDPASNDHEEEAGAESHKGSTTAASAGPNASMPGWEVSWPGKSTLLPARDTDQDGAKRRVYFLLPHDVAVPPTVTIARDGQPSLVLKPLPAIFPEKFDAESGSRGVLHTLWAKKRLSELEREMDAEMRANAEGVGLQMAFAEKQWIVDNFLTPVSTPQGAIPMSPRSPIAGRLGEKLKGLRLATSPEDLASPTANTFTDADAPSHSLSPLGGDIAVSSFASISQSSIDGATAGKQAPQDAEDDLFALPISPRSPDMKRSPFSTL